MSYRIALISGRSPTIKTFAQAVRAGEEDKVEFDPDLQYRFILDGHIFSSREEAEVKALTITRVLQGERNDTRAKTN